MRRSPGLPADGPLAYALSDRSISHGNRVRLLAGGADAFPAMLEAIESAERELLLESYIIGDDHVGRRFLDHLGRAARRGVDVRLICDGFGCLSLPAALLEAVEAAGGKVLIYHPVAFWRRRFALLRRDHRKMLVVDRRLGFVGGLNLADEYDDLAEAGHVWRDLHLRLEGPAVWALAGLFAITWNAESEPPRRMAWRPPVPLLFPVGGPGDGVAVQIVGNHETRHRALIRRTFLHAVRHARVSVFIANAYFIPDRTVIQALTSAARRGVDVRVIVPERSDVRLVDLAARAAFPQLLAAGVRIAEWRLGMMHAKAAVVDGVWATVGSYNLDHRSLRYNLEVTANVFDPLLASGLSAQIEGDFERSVELTADHLRRSWWLRVWARLAYQLRAWL